MAAPNPGSRLVPGQGADLYGQLIPLDADSLLLPNSAVVEVRSLDSVNVRSQPPGWLLGTVHWREHNIPVVSLEGLLGRAMPVRSRRSRLIVVNSVGNRLADGLVAIVIQGYPHLTALNRNVLQALPREPRDPDSLVLTRVRVANTLAIIPDLDAIEYRIAEVMPAGDMLSADEPWQPSAS
jgi:chemosensory pili system protein ChpC